MSIVLNAYVIFFVISIFLLVGGMSSAFKKSHHLSLYIAFILIFFIGFRADTTDYGNYFSHFISISNAAGIIDAFSSYRDGGHGVIIYFLSKISGSPLIYFVFYSAMSIGATWYVFRKTSDYAVFPWFFFITNGSLHQNMAQMRSGLATSLFLLAIYFLYKKRTLVWGGIIGVASSVHASAITGFFSYIFHGLRSGPIYFLIFSGALLASVFGGIGEVILINIFAVLEIQFGNISVRGLEYFDRSRNLTFIYFHMGFVFSIIFVIFRERMFKKNKFTYYLVPLNIIGSSFEVAMRDLGALAGRVGDLFTYGTEPLLWTVLISCFEKKSRIILIFAVGSWFLLKFANSNLLHDVSSYNLFWFSGYHEN